MSRKDPNCNCMNIKNYDGEYRCMECFEEFEPKREYRYFVEGGARIDPLEMLMGSEVPNVDGIAIFDEVSDSPEEVRTDDLPKLGTKRTDNLPLWTRERFDSLWIGEI